MNAWLHFDRGDYLLFHSWRPSSNGAIIAANIAIFTFSILERGLAYWRRFQEHRWRTRARTLVLKNQPASSSTVSAAGGENLEDSREAVIEVPVARPSQPRNAPCAIPRTIPPLIPSHDIPRGIIHAIQSALSYTLMLIVMTFNAGYIISVILGLGVGEIIFGCVERLHDARTAV
ncbi:hypothetical protein SCLCIDRAFT_140776 [Scleroderma citrinum Foug A]|uniref:Copper transport protein n=1 Tax=Scleroderma citrinum Foug A TaxID=1036808 RepID=A0A0C3CVP2_9AGAM|nr:hypothetical protein SCLCIDRAFT_140776 [Scleroderma citrinum Foug A]